MVRSVILRPGSNLSRGVITGYILDDSLIFILKIVSINALRREFWFSLRIFSSLCELYSA